MRSVGAAHLIDESTTIASLFQRSVNARPHAVAVAHGHRRWTYRRLDELANAVAWELATRMGDSASLVPLVVGEGVELPLSVLATLKLGVPWVPIDIAWPPALVARCLSDLEPAVTVCTAAGAAFVSGDEVVVDLDTLVPRADAPEPRSRPQADDVVYGFYTSGSSGAPKCALNLHGGVLNRLLAMTRCFADDGEVILQNSRAAFDSSIWQLLWPLTRGSAVILPSREGILDLEATIGEIARHGVTMTDFVPSVLNVLIKLIEARPDLRRQMTALRRILVGGEALSPHTVAALQALLPDTGLTNTYGATECSIGSIWHPIERETHAGPIPIGRAIDNTVAIILDDDLAPVAPKELGELYLGGLCVGAGYLGDERRSRESFIPNPFPDIPGATLYRTGDLGYMDEAGGNIYYGGRIDDEVKLNGARANLGDIEMVLRRCPEIADAAAVACNEDERTRLIAYVVARAGQDATGVRQYLSRVVPHELMPSRIITIDRMPLSHNGKIDRSALGELTSATSGDPPTRSAGSVEQRIVDLWNRILLPDHAIGPEDNFFDLGGDSLDLQRLVAELQGVIGRPVSIREVAGRPTVSALARLDQCHDDRTATADDEFRDQVEADLVLPADVRAPAGIRRSLRYVLLTGATGFVGAHLLNALLTDTPARVVCVIRAPDVHAAEHRLRSALRRQRLQLDRHWGRVDVVVGNLTLPQLGVPDARYAQLAEQLDTIVHCAATINLLLDYSWHRPTNVVGTREIIRLAAMGTPKHVHYVSSLAVRPSSRGATDNDGAPATGYPRSKWVAEKLLALAAKRGISSSVYRLGEVLPHSSTGASSSDGLVDSIVRAFVELGAYFPTDATIDYVPVDVAARSMVAATGRGIQHRRFDVVGHPPLRLGALFSTIADACGLRPVPYPEFWSRLNDHRAGGWRSDRRLLTVLPTPEHVKTRDPLHDLFGDPTPVAVSARSELVDATSVKWPPADRLMASWADAWRDRARTHEGHPAG